MGVQIASSSISGGDSVALAAGPPPGGWLPWVVGLLVPLAASLLVYLTGRGDRRQDRRVEDVRDFEKLVGEIELEHQRVRWDVVAEVDLKPLQDLHLKAELAPGRLPEALRLCARDLESSLYKYLSYAAGEREGRIEHRLQADVELKRVIAATFEDLEAYKSRRKG